VLPAHQQPATRRLVGRAVHAEHRPLARLPREQQAGRVQLAQFFADNIAPSAAGLADVVVGGAASLEDAQRMLVD